MQYSNIKNILLEIKIFGLQANSYGSLCTIYCNKI